jgi:hypothetical protein
MSSSVIIYCESLICEKSDLIIHLKERRNLEKKLSLVYFYICKRNQLLTRTRTVGLLIVKASAVSAEMCLMH